MFLIRTAFWLSLVILFIPTGETAAPGNGQVSDATEISAFEAIAAAQSTVSDLAGFCDRNPQTCETGSEALKVFGQKAQYGARKLYEYLAEANAGRNTASARDGIDTLLEQDRDAPWQGPGSQG